MVKLFKCSEGESLGLSRERVGCVVKGVEGCLLGWQSNRSRVPRELHSAAAVALDSLTKALRSSPTQFQDTAKGKTNQESALSSLES